MVKALWRGGAGGGDMRTRCGILAMKCFFLILLVLPACQEWPEVGGEGQPCSAKKTCRGNLVCEDGICVSIDGDGPETMGDDDRTTDSDVPSDGDDDTVADDDTESIDGDAMFDGDEEIESDAECECSTANDCCDGCHWTANACTPTDEHAQGGHCSEGLCLIDACRRGWHVSVDQLSCEEESIDGDDELPVDSDLEQGTDTEIPTDGDQDVKDEMDIEEDAVCSCSGVHACCDGCHPINQHGACGSDCQWCESGICENVPSGENADPFGHCGVCQVCNGSGGCTSALNGTDPKEQCSAGDCTNDACQSGACTKDNGTVCQTTNQCVSGVCEDCYDEWGCSNIAWGDRDNECTEVICGGDHTCSFNDTSEGSTCETGTGTGTSDQCDGNGLCVDCIDAGSCGDLPWGERDSVCSAHICQGDHNCAFSDETDGTSCSDGDQCVAGACKDCYDALGCTDLTWGDRVDECSNRVCGAGNLCAFSDETDGTSCSDGDQCVAGACKDCYDALGCTDLTWGDRVDECSNRVCGAGNLCAFSDETDGITCGTNDQCVAGACKDCNDISGCGDLLWGERDDQCSNLICGDGNTCTFYDELSSISCNYDADPCTADHCDGSGACTAETIPNDCEPMRCGDSPSGCYTCACSGNDTCQTETGDCIAENYALIPAGSFWMGSPDGCPGTDGYPGNCEAELGRDDDETLHFVELTYAFEMSKFEVTQGDWQIAFGNNPSYFGPNGDGVNCGDGCPIERLNWYEALAYANWFSEQAGLTPCYELTNCSGILGGGCGSSEYWCEAGAFNCAVSLNNVNKPQQCEGYRLPTEAEWEYAIRERDQYTAFYQSDGNDGTISVPSGGNDPNLDQIGWYHDNSDTGLGRIPHPGGEKGSNAWSLLDMSGNVSEMTWDKYCHDNTEYGNDPDAVACGSSAFIERGGDYSNDAQRCRSASRDAQPIEVRNGRIGFRLVRTLPITSCSPDPCNGHGSCNEAGEGETRPSCNCEAKYDGHWCNRCAAGLSCYPDCIETLTCINGVCRDPDTCFEWQETPTGGNLNWSSAKTYCQNLDLDGTGWRLPNISESRTLVRNCSPIETGGECGVKDICSPCGVSVENVCIADSGCYDSGYCNPSSCTNGGGPTGCYWLEQLAGACFVYWSSSPIVGASLNAWSLDFLNGIVKIDGKDTDRPARCVR
ncbi:MAG: DUF1566 domain-containing protein [Myxococcales bacterium]|nr:MAG: DUF1566 domain-containing protein [Myxococcales bacterium]